MPPPMEPPFIDKATLKLFGFCLLGLPYSLSTCYALLQLRNSELYENCFIFGIFSTFVIFSHIPINCKGIELFAKCPPESKALYGFQRLRLKDSLMYRFQVILLRGVVLFIEIPGTLGHFVAHYVLDLPESWPMACHFYYSLILPAAAEVMVSIISLQVKKFKPKPNLRIDFIFLVILTAVLYLGEFSFPCLIISSVIIIIFEAMYIWDICCAKIIMWSESERCEYTTSSG